MAVMTRAELNDQIKSVMLPLLKDTCAPVVSELVEAQITKALEKNEKAPAWASELFTGKRATAPQRDKGLGFGAIVRATAVAKMDGTGRQGILDNLDQWGYTDIVAEVAKTKALGATQGNAGGYLVTPTQSNEIIELRRSATVVRGLGPRTLPLPTGTTNVPKITAGASGGYIGENTNAPKSQQTFGNVQMTAKKLAVLVPISNDLIRNASPQADAVVRDDVVRSLAVTEDRAFLRADGTNGTPKGLRYWAPAGNIVAAGATSLAQVSSDLGSLMLALMSADVMAGNWAWIIAPRTWKYLTTVQNTNGFYVFRDEMVNQKTLWGFPYRVTTSVPINLTVGSNADCSEITLVNMDDMAIGDNLNLTIDVSQEAAYHDGSSVVAAFSQDQTVIRAIAEHDFVARYAEAIAVLTGVRWN